MQCPISNGKPPSMNFCCPLRPDISSRSKAFGPLCFLCVSQMAPRGYREKPARNFFIYELRIRSCKPNRHFSNCLVSCGIPIYWPNILGTGVLGNWTLRSVNSRMQARGANNQLRWWTFLTRTKKGFTGGKWESAKEAVAPHQCCLMKSLLVGWYDTTAAAPWHTFSLCWPESAFLV